MMDRALCHEIKPNLQTTFNNIPIDNVTQFKYLGVWLDPSLTWNVHIDKLAKKVNKHVGVLRMVRSVFPQHTLNLLYKTVILSHFEYCDTVVTLPMCSFKTVLLIGYT